MKIIDPACGSGAFPIGMLQLLLSIYERLEPRFDVYKSKIFILKNNIFGVDIEPMAVEIARLRSWLAIIVDEERISENIEPLPNLEFKFLCANSLLKLDDGSVRTLFDQTDDIENRIQKLRSEYFLTTESKIKNEIKNKFSKLIQQQISLFGESKRKNQILTFQPFSYETQAIFFDSDFMFGVDKFDIVIGNPPYVRQEKIIYKSNLVDYKIYDATADLSTYFFEFALNNLNQGGSYCYIVTNKFFRTLYGNKLRKYLATNTTLNKIINFEGEKQFLASVDTAIVLGTNNLPNLGNKVEVDLIQTKKNINVEQSELKNGPWNFLNDIEQNIFLKITKNSKNLIEYTDGIYLGIKSGCKEAFIINEETKNELISRDKNNAKIIFPVLEGKDIRKYAYNFCDNYLVVTKNEFNIEKQFPFIASYLNKKNKELNNKIKERGDQGNHWMNLRHCAYYDKMESEKIVWSDIAKTNQFCKVNSKMYIVNTVYSMIPNKNVNINILLGILNSRVILAYMMKFANIFGTQTIRWQTHIVQNLPIPKLENISKKLLDSLNNLVEEREKSVESQVNIIESKINEIVYKIYKLETEEIELLNSFFIDSNSSEI